MQDLILFLSVMPATLSFCALVVLGIWGLVQSVKTLGAGSGAPTALPPPDRGVHYRPGAVADGSSTKRGSCSSAIQPERACEYLVEGTCPLLPNHCALAAADAPAVGADRQPYRDRTHASLRDAA